MRDSDPSVGHQSQTLQETSKPLESEQTVWPGRSPLTSELLALDEELTEMLDYEDLEENDPGVPDPEITQAVAHIPQADAFTDVEMQESQPPPGFEPEVTGLGMMLTWSARTPLDRGNGKPDVGRSVLQNPRCWLAGYQGRPLPFRGQLTFGALFPEDLLLIHEDG